MKNKGFTLIELLAVIVILAIIALIATPIILDVIDTARKGAKESSVLGYVDSVEKQVMLAQVDSTATKIEPGTYTVAQLKALGVQVKGEVPEDTSVITIGDKGQVTNAWITYKDSDYKVYYDGSEAVADPEDYVDSKGVKHNDVGTPVANVPIVKGPLVLEDIYIASAKQEGVKGIVYLDPTNLTTICDSSNSTTGGSSSTGCMKWYIYDDSGSNYKLLLDHNIASTVWNSTGSNSSMKEPTTILNSLSTTPGWAVSASLISADELRSIVSNASSTSAYKWTFENLLASGGSGNSNNGGVTCDSIECNPSSGGSTGGSTSGSTRCYWTSTKDTSNNNSAIAMFIGGLLRSNAVNGDRCGIRPVITVPKSTFSS